jgi:hypothetical protein
MEDNLPNMPYFGGVIDEGLVVRVNDGNDSNNRQDEVIAATACYPHRFYNTSIPRDLDKFNAPVVLTVNPGAKTDADFHRLDPVPANLMFVRVRTNAWNLGMVSQAVQYYSSREIPVVLTFMAYFHEEVREDFKYSYMFRTRTLNPYWCITSQTWKNIMYNFSGNKWVWSCGRLDLIDFDSHCRFCGNCLREYHACKERMKGGKAN